MEPSPPEHTVSFGCECAGVEWCAVDLSVCEVVGAHKALARAGMACEVDLGGGGRGKKGGERFGNFAYRGQG